MVSNTPTAVPVQVVGRAVDVDVGEVVGAGRVRGSPPPAAMRISVSPVGCTTSVGTVTAGMRVGQLGRADDSPDHVDSQPRAVIVRASPP